MDAIKKFLATDQQSWSLLVARLALGLVILPHGMQKALGAFGGYGFSGTLGAFQSMGMPLLIGVLVILAEFVGSIGILVGAGTRFYGFLSWSHYGRSCGSWWTYQQRIFHELVRSAKGRRY